MATQPDEQLDAEAVNRRTVEQFCAAWLRRDVEGCLRCVAADIVYCNGTAEILTGRDEVGAAFARLLTMEDDSDTVLGVIEVFGDRAIGPWSVFSTDEAGRRTELRGVDVYTLSGGLIRGKDVFAKAVATRTD